MDNPSMAASASGVFDSFIRDFRYGIRTLARTPGFSLVAIVVMALGIGASAALFTVVHSVLLKPLPLPDVDRLVAVYEADTKLKFNNNSVAGARSIAGSRRIALSSTSPSAPKPTAISPRATASFPNESTPSHLPGLRFHCSASNLHTAGSSRPTTINSAPMKPLSSPGVSGSAASEAILRSSAAPSCSIPNPTPLSAFCPPGSPTPIRGCSFGCLCIRKCPRRSWRRTTRIISRSSAS